MAARSGRLRDADELLLPAVAATVKALDPPESDAAVVRLAEICARSIDDMPPAVKAAMVGQSAGVLLKLLVELHVRAEKRARAGREAEEQA